MVRISANQTGSRTPGAKYLNGSTMLYLMENILNAEFIISRSKEHTYTDYC
jgi:hypothetical protein